MFADKSSPIVIAGIACRVPGADSVEAFAALLFGSQTGYADLPAERCDRTLYFDPAKGKTGKSYTTLGGVVPERPLDRETCPLNSATEKLFDAAHVQFAEVAATAWKHAGLLPNDGRFEKTGVYVGHSGGTKSGGGLSLGTQIDEALSLVNEIPEFQGLSGELRRSMISEVTEGIRRDRPLRRMNELPSFHAYQAAALSARVLGLTGPRSVIDAACASSLVALAQAIMAIRSGRIDSAIVGGATYNNVDNLILFSHSQACTATDSRPFDDGASGLVSSEGYVAIVITTQDKAEELGLSVLGVIRGVGMASDGKGRSLWAPRMEGQVLALRRAYTNGALLDIDYLEAHATSTQLGDATELETLRKLSEDPQARIGRHQLLLGSVKSNIGHTLEAAGLIGLVKVLIAMKQGQIPPSLRYEQPNRNYDWSTAPVRVVAKTETWNQPQLRPRRAAVSAFGIGGLNAHVVVEEKSQRLKPRENGVVSAAQSSFTSELSMEPIAIVGRGLVVAGAKNLTEFASILNSDRSALREAPPERWRDGAGVSKSGGPATYRSPHNHGGFITDFVFDGARYRIPPKQVQQANPVQMMLIDAVSQALADLLKGSNHATAGNDKAEPKGVFDDFPMDRQRIGVVIGTIFGGEFGDQLQVGMRLPEICGKMTESLEKRGVLPATATKIAEEFRRVVLKDRPALLDETGSFTASTLASRVAKTFDLMGGACALDSDDASGLAALAVAADQLRSGLCDMVVCGSAQRSMSLSAFEALDMSGRLVRTGRAEDVPNDCRQIIPGEGVVALMLCRLSDAERLGLPIYGLLGDQNQAAAVNVMYEPRHQQTYLDQQDAEIVRKVGYLSGAHALVRIAAETTKSGEDRGVINIAAKTSDDIVMQIPLYFAQSVGKHTARSSKIQASDSFQSKSILKPILPANNQVLQAMTNVPAAPGTQTCSVRFAATSGGSLIRLLKEAIAQSEQISLERTGCIFREQQRGASSSGGFVREDCYRAVVLADTADQLRSRLSAAVKATEAGRFRGILDRERVVLWQTRNETPRVAWLFPGQGSHYLETPSAFSTNAAARETLAKVDALFEEKNLPRLSVAFGNAAIRPGDDVWWAQAWVLGVSASLIESLKAEGLRPDAVLGHSFGEFTASLASNVTTLPQTIELARHRANAVVSHMRTAGGLLSVRAAVHEVDAVLKSAALPVYVTHLNSPRQTVIAGSRDGIVAAKALLDRQGFAAMSIPVPAPFHTPLLAEAELAFERMSASVPMRPPVCGFLSATSVQYLAEPSGIRQSLVRQLTQPVMYLPSIQRMLGEDFCLFLEVGPNDVLTRMNRDIVDSQALCLSLDVPGQAFEERMALVHAAMECVSGQLPSQQFTNDSMASSRSATVVTNDGREGNRAVGHSAAVAEKTAAPSEDAVFDVTKSRRTVRKPSQAVAQDHDSFAASAPSAGRPPVIIPSRGVDLMAAASAPQATPQAPAISEVQLRTYVRDLVVELTGYAPDIVDFEADLEADLGIDSIKKAQILGEIGEWMGLTVRPESLRLDSVRTLDDAVRVAQKLASESETSASEQSSVSSVAMTMPLTQYGDQNPVQTGFVPASKVQTSGPGTTKTSSRSLPPDDRLDSLLIDYVVDQTGYSRDIVDVDADLEADLGLDSIKLAQLIGEMREQFGLESLTLESISQARFRTLRGIREFLVTHDGGASEQTDGNSGDGRPESAENPNAPSGAASPVTMNPSNGYGHSGNGAITATPEFAIQHLSTAVHSGERYAPSFESVPEIRGTEPVNGITSEWLEWLNLNGHEHQPAEVLTQTGILIGQQHQARIRAALRSMVYLPTEVSAEQHWSPAEAARLRGVAVGAGVAEASVRLAAALVRNRSNGTYSQTIDFDPGNSEASIDDEVATNPTSPQQTNRYELRVVPAPRRAGMPLHPELHGAVLILGANALADAIADQVQKLGQKVFILSTSSPIAQMEKTLAELWHHTPTPHLFLTMAFDADSAKSLNEADWKRRRAAALEAPFRICQLWMQRTIDANLMEDASVVSVTQLGGDFGFSGQRVRSIEAIGGLVKAMLIEAWMRGFRTTPMKCVDVAADMNVQEVASGVLQELAVPSYDMEIAFRASARPLEPERLSVQAVASPLRIVDSARTSNRITRGGTWVVSGGGRGITAVIAMTLAKKYSLQLHMLGTAPVPNLSDEFVRQVAMDRSGVRRAIMQEASGRGENPVEAWRNTEKAIEIDATLRECRQHGITARYYCCDVSDFRDVEDAVRQIRQQAGPIRGVIHGAGAGQDARFDRKRPDKVEKCLKAKIDGSLALMQATTTDPLEHFVTFGSISGRFGANGHTDYSLANDMMAKIVDRYRSDRPDVRSVTFHWHAWGDIGMATKPEAKLALEMIDMEFMPARDGISHFMRELEFGGNEAEVLITDESYFRKFFPAERLSLTVGRNEILPLPLVPATFTQHEGGVCSSVVTLNPVSDRFLSQHRVQGRPTLPFVVALELMAEAVRVRVGSSYAGVCLEARALQAIRFSTDDPLAVTIQTVPSSNGTIECRLLADVRRRDGRMVEEDREFFRAIFDPAGRNGSGVTFERPINADWKRIEYVAPEGLIYHGTELQELREVCDDGENVFGRIAASAPVQLFGGSRARGFSVPCATMDACLYAVGYAAWNRHQKPSLPVRFDRIEFGRLPDPGEPCLVRIQQIHTSESGAVWDFQLQGHNGDRLITVTGYRIGWLMNG